MVSQSPEVAHPLANAPAIQRTHDRWQAHRRCRPLRERRLSRWTSWDAPSRAVELLNHLAATRVRCPL
jgi:hypothetical protein